MLRRAAALSAALAIAAAAFGAHAAADARAAELLRTGGMYELIHAVAIVALGERWSRPCWLMLGASCLFAVTLYALALGAPRWLGAVTPLGGAGMIAAWLWVALARREPRS